MCLFFYLVVTFHDYYFFFLMSSALWKSLHGIRGNRFVPKLPKKLHDRTDVCLLHICSQRVR